MLHTYHRGFKEYYYGYTKTTSEYYINQGYIGQTLNHTSVRGSHILPDQLLREHISHKAASRHCGLLKNVSPIIIIFPFLYSRQMYCSWTCSGILWVFFIVHPSYRHAEHIPVLTSREALRPLACY